MDVEELKGTLMTAASNMINLQIMTVVGAPAITLDGKRFSHSGIADGAFSIGTIINMIEGDISTVISTEIATGDLKEIRTFHDNMVTKAEGIVNRNMKVVMDIIERFSGGGGGGGGGGGQ